MQLTDEVHVQHCRQRLTILRARCTSDIRERLCSRVIQSSFTDDYGGVHGYGIMYGETQNAIH